VSTNEEQDILKQWETALGQNHILPLVDPKGIVDVMLGVLAVHSRVITYEAYIADMKERGQTIDRIQEVEKALAPVVKLLETGN